MLDRTLRGLRIGWFYREARPLTLQKTLCLTSKMLNLNVENFHIRVKRSLKILVDVQFRLWVHQRINFTSDSLSVQDRLERDICPDGLQRIVRNGACQLRIPGVRLRRMPGRPSLQLSLLQPGLNCVISEMHQQPGKTIKGKCFALQELHSPPLHLPPHEICAHHDRDGADDCLRPGSNIRAGEVCEQALVVHDSCLGAVQREDQRPPVAVRWTDMLNRSAAMLHKNSHGSHSIPPLARSHMPTPASTTAMGNFSSDARDFGQENVLSTIPPFSWTGLSPQIATTIAAMMKPRPSA